MGRDKNQLNVIDDEDLDLENYLYRIYFKDEELERVKEAQERKVFDQLIKMKHDAVKDA